MDGLLSPREWVDIARGAGVRAIAITDFQDAAGFQEAAQAVEELRKEAEPEELDFKMLYGMETVLEDGCPVHLLVRCQEGLAQLYRLLEISWQDREERPFLRKAEIGGHRSGLLVGCPGEGGEVWRGILDNLDDARLEEIAGFYDYLLVLVGGGTTVWIIAGKLWKQMHGLPLRPVADQPLFYLAMLTVVLGVQLFLAGFLGELINRGSSDRNKYLIDKKL